MRVNELGIEKLEKLAQHVACGKPALRHINGDDFKSKSESSAPTCSE